MRKRTHRATAVAVALTLGPAAAALAGAMSGRTYEGSVPSSGVNGEGHRVRTHATGRIVLRVASSGSSVSVRFSSSAPVLYCNTQQRIHVQSGRSASISSNGSFKATVNERFAAGPGAAAVVQVVTGRFSGGSVHGAISTQAGECGGRAGFSANAR